MGMMINIYQRGTKNYEFYNVPEKVGKAIITLLHECKNNDSKIFFVESEEKE